MSNYYVVGGSYELSPYPVWDYRSRYDSKNLEDVIAQFKLIKYYHDVTQIIEEDNPIIVKGIKHSIGVKRIFSYFVNRTTSCGRGKYYVIGGFYGTNQYPIFDEFSRHEFMKYEDAKIHYENVKYFFDETKLCEIKSNRMVSEILTYNSKTSKETPHHSTLIETLNGIIDSFPKESSTNNTTLTIIENILLKKLEKNPCKDLQYALELTKELKKENL